jgi:aryl-alcohol dehydrogenase-like predicted oxidoreductase
MVRRRFRDALEPVVPAAGRPRRDRDSIRPRQSACVEYQQLGTSGLVVSRIGYGNSVTAGEQLDDESSMACVRAALAEGITFFDTADAYAGGRAEEVLGKALRDERRDGLVICTKVFFPTGPGPNDRGLSRKHVISGVEASLRRLNTDYVDIYLAHRYDARVPLEETMTAFADVVRSGKALYVGVSEWTAGQILAAKRLADELRVPLICDEAQYSMLWRVVEAGVVDACLSSGVGLIAWSPLAGGVLTGKYRAGERPPDGSRLAAVPTQARSMQRWRRLDPEVLRRVQELRAVADEHGLTMAQLALAWVLRQPAVAGLVVGASRPEQIARNTAAVDKGLDDPALKRIDEVLGDVVVRAEQ